MAIARDTYGSTNITPSTTQTLGLTIGAGATILLAWTVSDGAASAASSVVWNGTESMTPIVSTTNANQEMGSWYLINPTSGSYNLVATWPNADYSMLGAISYTGTATSGQPDASSVATSGSATGLSTTITTVADNSWVAAGAVQQSGPGPITGSGIYTRVASGTWNGFALLDSNAAITPAGSQNVGFTTTNAAGGCLLINVSIKPPGSAGGVSTPVSTLAFLGAG